MSMSIIGVEQPVVFTPLPKVRTEEPSTMLDKRAKVRASTDHPASTTPRQPGVER